MGGDTQGKLNDKQMLAVGLLVQGLNDGEVAEKVKEIFDMKPAAIIERFGLTNPIFQETAAYGHMGRKPETKEVEVCYNGKNEMKSVQLFGWEELNYVDKVREAFSLVGAVDNQEVGA